MNPCEGLSFPTAQRNGPKDDIHKTEQLVKEAFEFDLTRHLSSRGESKAFLTPEFRDELRQIVREGFRTQQASVGPKKHS